MNVTVIGMGRVGLVVGACLADLGSNVFCLESDLERLERLQHDELADHEPGLQKLIRKNVDAGRLAFSADVERSVAHAALQFIAVGTPSDADGAADLGDVLGAARNIGLHMRDFKAIVIKSTVPVGSAQQVRRAIEVAQSGRARPLFAVVSNPEFLREGTAVDNFMRPDRIVLGVSRDGAGQTALAMMRQLYAPLNVDQECTCVMDNRSAEFTKYAANAMLATRVSFMNELANLAEQITVDIESVREGVGLDRRIGDSYLQPGAGYGGSCLPKDVKALIRDAQAHGQDLRLLKAVDEINTGQQEVLVRKVMAHFGGDLRGRDFAIWGLAFKPGTDDVRAAPSRTVMGALLRAGARVVAHDPVANHACRQAMARDLADATALLGELTFVDQRMDAVKQADALILATEWEEYRHLDFDALRANMKSAVIFDGRNLYDPVALATHGFTHYGIGRGIRRV
ncbi:MAG: UDP-glucose/GDP-mannose dehydrogenase family protein [Ramlibacter sp.]